VAAEPTGTTAEPVAAEPTGTTAEPVAAEPTGTTVEPVAAEPTGTTVEPVAAEPTGTTGEPVAAEPTGTTGESAAQAAAVGDVAAAGPVSAEAALAPTAEPTDSAAAPPPGRKHRVGRVARSTVAVVLIVLGVICFLVAPLAIWGRNLLLDTNKYVNTLAPVASNPGVQTAVVNAVNKRVMDNIDVTSYVGTVLPDKVAKVIGPPLQSGISNVVNTVTTKFVQSEAFHTIWVQANRQAHQTIVYLLTGKTPPSVTIDRSGRVYLDLSTVVTNVKDQLVKSGITVAKNVPVVGTTIQIANLHGLSSARHLVRILNTVANWLPWVGLALLAGGIAAAHRRRRALITSMLGVAGAMIVLGIGLLIARHLFITSIPSDKLPTSTSGYLFDTVVRYLRWGIRAVLAVALLVALGAWVSGPSASATAIRRALAGGPRAIGARMHSGPVVSFVDRYATPLRVLIIALGGIILLLINSPSWVTLLILGLIVVVLLLLVEVARAAAQQAVPEATAAAEPEQPSGAVPAS
jgi:hypothetical protein